MGPRDLPRLVKLFGSAYRRVRRFYGDTTAGLVRLEREIGLASSKDNPEQPEFLALIPEHLREKVAADLGDAQSPRAAHQPADETSAAPDAESRPPEAERP